MKKFGLKAMSTLLLMAMLAVSFTGAVLADGTVVKNYFIKSGFDNMPASFNNSTGAGVIDYFDLLKQGGYSNASTTTVATRVTSNRISGASGISGDYAPKLTLDKKLDTATTYNVGDGTYLQMWPLDGAIAASKLIFEMDTNITMAGQITFQNLFNTYNVNLFGSDGKIYGSNTNYAVGVWKKLRIEFDYTEGVNKADIYYDNTYCSTINGVSEADFRDSAKPIVIRMMLTTDAGIGFAIDNVALYEEVTSNKITAAGYTLGGAEKSGTVIPPAAENIILTMAEGFDTNYASASVKLLKDGVSVESTITNADDKITVVPTAGFVGGGDYTLLINESASPAGAGYGVDFSVLSPSAVNVKNYFIKSDFDRCENWTDQIVAQDKFEAMFDILSAGKSSDSASTTVVNRKHFRRVGGASGAEGDYAYQTGVNAKLDQTTTTAVSTGEGTILQLMPLAGAKTAEKIVLEMDTKISAPGRVRFQNIFNSSNSGNLDVFLADGKIYGSTTEYAMGAWKKLRIEFDYTEGVNKADIYYNGAYCSSVNNISTAAYRTGSYMFIRLNEAYNTAFDFAIDNLKMYEVAPIDTLYNAGYAVGGSVKKGNAVEAIVPSGADSIALSMMDGFDTSAATATLVSAGANHTSAVSKSGQNILVTPEGGFTAGESYKVFLNGSGTKSGPGYEIEYTCAEVDKITLSDTDSGYKAEALLVSDKETTCTFIIAQYESEHRLSSVSIKTLSVEEGINRLSARCAADGDAALIKAMCWSEFNTLQPLANSVTK